MPRPTPISVAIFTIWLNRPKSSVVGPNIVVKLPATRAGIRAYEECAALGINVAATVSFTVSQVLAVGEAAKRGKERAKGAGVAPPLTIAVLMVGRLDDYLRDVVQDRELAITEEDIRQAGTACIKGAYALLRSEGTIPSSCQPDVVELTTSRPRWAKMIMSISRRFRRVGKFG